MTALPVFHRGISSSTQRGQSIIAKADRLKPVVSTLRGTNENCCLSTYNLSVGKIRSIIIPIPPKQEGQRILVKINELTALCDPLKTHIQQIQQTNLHLADAVVEQVLG